MLSIICAPASWPACVAEVVLEVEQDHLVGMLRQPARRSSAQLDVERVLDRAAGEVAARAWQTTRGPGLGNQCTSSSSERTSSRSWSTSDSCWFGSLSDSVGPISVALLNELCVPIHGASRSGRPSASAYWKASVRCVSLRSYDGDVVAACAGVAAVVGDVALELRQAVRERVGGGSRRCTSDDEQGNAGSGACQPKRARARETCGPRREDTACHPRGGRTITPRADERYGWRTYCPGMNPVTLSALEIVRPGDERYDEVRPAWNLTIDQRPAAVAVPRDADQVVAAVLYAKREGLRVAAQGTGHNAGAARRPSDTLLIKTHEMRGVEIDADNRVARVEAGAQWGDVVGPAGEHGLAALAGSSHDVGVVGYSLGGGISFLARRYGLAANRILAAEVVTADGELVRADRRRTSRPVLGDPRRRRRVRRHHRARDRAVRPADGLRRRGVLPDRARVRGAARLARADAEASTTARRASAASCACRRSRTSPSRSAASTSRWSR